MAATWRVRAAAALWFRLVEPVADRMAAPSRTATSIMLWSVFRSDDPARPDTWADRLLWRLFRSGRPEIERRWAEQHQAWMQQHERQRAQEGKGIAGAHRGERRRAADFPAFAESGFVDGPGMS